LTVRVTPPATLGGLIAGIALLLACAPCAPAAQPTVNVCACAPAVQPTANACMPCSPAAQPAVSGERLAAYVERVARAWMPFTNAEGDVTDPLNQADTGDNYGVVMLADVMLKVARRTDDSQLEATGVRILDSTLTLPPPGDPFNLLAIASVIHDGQSGEFPTAAWAQLAGPLALLAGQIGPPTGQSCLSEPGCYSNWRLVWAAGAAQLLADHLPGEPGSLTDESAWVGIQIKADLALAMSHAGMPVQSSVARYSRSSRRTASPALTRVGLGGWARELSDPGAEPPAYELFSTFMLELLDEADPTAITPAVARLQGQADRYALDMMAPDGQLSLAGRSLDQSWVQAAAASLGARRAALEGASAGAWRAYADRAASYLLSAYPLQPDGLLPIVPGLALEWSPSIMDGYAALNQYEGLTLWFLSDALDRWPAPQAPRAALPADGQSLLVDDLSSSGLVWGRSAGVWWELSGRSTSGDPRAAQGLVAVKLDGPSGWRDLLALRPLHGKALSTWTLQSARGAVAVPTFTRVRGTGSRVVLLGRYKNLSGRAGAHVSWTLSAGARGVKLSMSVPAKATLHTTVWLTPQASHLLLAPGASTTRGSCLVSASGAACPVTVSWRNQRVATLEIGAAGAAT
jgi:hypothetical protein